MKEQNTAGGRLAALLTAGVLAMSVPGVALAQDEAKTETDRAGQTDRAPDRPSREDAIARVKERAAAAIERRLATLDRLAGHVNGHEHVTDSHETALLRDYGDAVAGLTELGAEIASATIPEELRALIPKIAEDYRVYLVIVPKTHEVIVSDTLPAVADRLGELADRLDEAIAQAAEAGFDVTAAEALVETARGEIAEAARLAHPVAGQVINLTAQHWPDPAEQKLQSGRDDLQAARESLVAGREALREAHLALRTAIGRDTPAAE